MPGIRYPLLSILAKEMCLVLSLLLAPAQGPGVFLEAFFVEHVEPRSEGLYVIQGLRLAHRLGSQQHGS